jgi:hypothetical protein
VENVKEEIRQLVGPYAGTRGALQARRMPARDPPEEGERFPTGKAPRALGLFGGPWLLVHSSKQSHLWPSLVKIARGWLTHGYFA